MFHSVIVQAAGVQKPTAIAITYAEPGRYFRATEILREAFPDSPIFVRCDEHSRLKKLIQAGATKVIVATGSVASGIGQLLGVRRSGRVLGGSGAAVTIGNMAATLFPPMDNAPDQKPSGQADKIDSVSDREITRTLFRLFSTFLTLNEYG